jgi:2-dehydropantoate 2-reductase
MRIAIVGAGGVGGLIGGLLARAGIPVSLVARGEQLRAIRERGLRVDSVTRGSFTVTGVEASDDPAALPPGDVVLVAVKGWQVREVAPRLAPLMARGAVAIPLENGVESADELARALGEERVAGGLCHMLSWIEEPGRIRHVGEQLLVTIGERAGGSSARLEAIAAELRRAGVDVALSPDVTAATWEKFLFIEPLGAVGAVTRAPVGVVRSVPESRALLVAAMEETARLARARGVRLAPDAVGRALELVDRLPPDATASMQRDVQAGRPSELQDQTGAVVRLGKDSALPCPVHAFLYSALLPQEAAARRAAERRA